MAICETCGLDHHPELVEHEEEAAAEAVAEAAVDATRAEARGDVEVAKVEGETAIELAKISAKVEQGWQDERLVALEARLGGMQEVLDRLTAPPGPAEPEPEPMPEEVIPEPPAPEEQAAPPKPEAPKKSKGWWG